MKLERILAIRPRALGDVVLTLPALRSLRRGHPGARLDVLTDPRYTSLVQAVPDVDRVLPFERSAPGTLALIARLRAERYDLAVDFFGNARTAFVTALCGAGQTAGYDLRGRRYGYRTRVARNVTMTARRSEYAAASHLRLAAAVGGRADGEDARIPLTPERRAEAQRILSAAGVRSAERTVGVVAAGTWGTKTWPLSHFAVLCRGLRSAGHEVLVITGPGEERLVSRLLGLAPGVLPLPPCRDALELAAVVAGLRALVGTDSGPRHLAAAFGVPTFAWFGPADPEIWTPDDGRHGTWWTELPCRACNRTRCPHWNCLPGLAPERALHLVLDHLERHARSIADLGAAARA